MLTILAILTAVAAFYTWEALEARPDGEALPAKAHEITRIHQLTWNSLRKITPSGNLSIKEFALLTVRRETDETFCASGRMEERDWRIPLSSEAGVPKLLAWVPGAGVGDPRFGWLVYDAGSPGTQYPVRIIRGALIERTTGKVRADVALDERRTDRTDATSAIRVEWDADARELRAWDGPVLISRDSLR